MGARESQMLLEVWESVRDVLPAPKRQEAAINIVRAFAEYGIEADDLHDAVDEDSYLAKAVPEVFESEDEDEYDDEMEDE